MSRGKIREKKPALVGLDAELSELPRVLKEMRLNAKMTGKAAGDELCARGFSHKTHYSALSRYENGFRVPLLRIFIALCQIYGVRPSVALKRAGLDTVETSTREIVRQREEAIETEVDPGENTRCMIYISDTLREAVGDLAHARGMNFSEFVRKLLRDELKRLQRRQQAG